MNKEEMYFVIMQSLLDTLDSNMTNLIHLLTRVIGTKDLYSLEASLFLHQHKLPFIDLYELHANLMEMRDRFQESGLIANKKLWVAHRDGFRRVEGKSVWDVFEPIAEYVSFVNAYSSMLYLSPFIHSYDSDVCFNMAVDKWDAIELRRLVPFPVENFIKEWDVEKYLKEFSIPSCYRVDPHLLLQNSRPDILYLIYCEFMYAIFPSSR